MQVYFFYVKPVYESLIHHLPKASDYVPVSLSLKKLKAFPLASQCMYLN